MKRERPTRILLVEDEPADVEFTRYAFARGRLDHEITVCMTGRTALDHLGATDVLPDLILLDLALPDMTGLDVIEEIRADPDLTAVPVIVLSTSSVERDVLALYRAHANAYVQKPLRLAGLEEFVRSLETFWFGSAILPGTR